MHSCPERQSSEEVQEGEEEVLERHWMQGRVERGEQVRPWDAQKSDPPRVHSSPVHWFWGVLEKACCWEEVDEGGAQRAEHWFSVKEQV